MRNAGIFRCLHLSLCLFLSRCICATVSAETYPYPYEYSKWQIMWIKWWSIFAWEWKVNKPKWNENSVCKFGSNRMRKHSQLTMSKTILVFIFFIMKSQWKINLTICLKSAQYFPLIFAFYFHEFTLCFECCTQLYVWVCDLHRNIWNDDNNNEMPHGPVATG